MDTPYDFYALLEQSVPVKGQEQEQMLKPKQMPDGKTLSNTLGNVAIDRHDNLVVDEFYTPFAKQETYFYEEEHPVNNKSIIDYINQSVATSVAMNSNPRHAEIAKAMKANASSPKKFERWNYYATTPLKELYSNAKENSEYLDPTFDNLMKSVMRNEGGGANESLGDGHVTSWGLTKANYKEKVLGIPFSKLTAADARRYVDKTLGARMSPDFLKTVDSPALAFLILEQLHNSGSGAKRITAVLNEALGLKGDKALHKDRFDKRTINGELAKMINAVGADEVFFKLVENTRNNYLYNQSQKAKYINERGETVRNSADFIDGWMDRLINRNPFAIRKDHKKVIKRELKPISKAEITPSSALEALGLGIVPRKQGHSLSQLIAG